MKEVLKFSASWCQPCKALATMLYDHPYKDIVKDVDIDKDMELAIQYGVRSVPTMIMLEDGKEIKRKNGLPTHDELTTWFSD